MQSRAPEFQSPLRGIRMGKDAGNLIGFQGFGLISYILFTELSRFSVSWEQWMKLSGSFGRY